MEDDALTEEDEALALNVLESEDHTEDEQILTQHVILEQEDKTPSPIATNLSAEATKTSAFSTTTSSSSSSSSTANLISGSAQGVATVSTRVQVDTALAQVQVSDTTHPRSPMTKGGRQTITPPTPEVTRPVPEQPSVLGIGEQGARL